MMLLPRPAPHLPRTAEAFRAAGFANLHLLALSHPETLPVILPATATALIITSPLAVRPGLPPLPTYCVGPATAGAAAAAGCPIAYTGTNNGQTMAKAITQHAPRTTKHDFIHLHGDHAGTDWYPILRRAGHAVTPVLAYHTHRITALPAETQTLLASTAGIMVPLFSPGSARHLANLFKQANIQPSGTVIAFSPAVAQAASSFWSHVVTAPRPTLEAMTATIRRLKG